MDEPTSRQPSGEPNGDHWTFTLNPAVRALLDHMAKELAAEFVRLMRASVEQQSEPEPKEKGR
jgi:hypothetical protein